MTAADEVQAKRYSLLCGAVAETRDTEGNPSGEYVKSMDYDKLRAELAALRHDLERHIAIAAEEATRADSPHHLKQAARYRWLQRQRSDVWREFADIPINRTDELIDVEIAKEGLPAAQEKEAINPALKRISSVNIDSDIAGVVDREFWNLSDNGKVVTVTGLGNTLNANALFPAVSAPEFNVGPLNGLTENDVLAMAERACWSAQTFGDGARAYTFVPEALMVFAKNLIAKAVKP